MRPEVYIIVPAKNEAFRIGNVLFDIKSQGFDNIIVVDDGSDDRTGAVARSFGATVLTHLTNLGAGAATQTGIEYALDCGADMIVTIDGDEQHFATDIPKLINALETRPIEVAIGSRFLEKNGSIPAQRIFYNRVGNIVTRLITGIRVTDSQSGLKAMHANFARKVKFRFDGYEFCTEFIYLLRKHRVKYDEVPIGVRYTSETLGKGQSLLNGFRMLFRLLTHYV